MLERALALSIDLTEEAEHVETCLREIEVDEGKISKDETTFIELLQLLADLSNVVRVIHHVLEGKVQHLLYFPICFPKTLLCEIK